MYAVGTNASVIQNSGVQITLTNSKFISDAGYQVNNGKGDGDSCPVMINVPGTLNMNGCTVKGTRQAIMVRGGTANIENCVISIAETTTDDGCTYGSPVYVGTDKDNYSNNTWGSGNNVPMAAMVVGNRHETSYQYPTTCSLTGTTVTTPEGVNKIYTYAQESTGNR